MKKVNWIVIGVVFLGLIAVIVAVGMTALGGSNSQPSAATQPPAAGSGPSSAAGSGPAVSGLFDGTPGSSQTPVGPDRITIEGKIDSVNNSGLQLLNGPHYKETDRVVVNLYQNAKIVDAKGQSLKLADLKKGYRVTVETDPVAIMTFPAQVKAYTVTVLE